MPRDSNQSNISPAESTRHSRNAFGWTIVFVAVFISLLVWRHAYLDSPPYWDAATGLWTEASFLADTNFDLAGLKSAKSETAISSDDSIVAAAFLALLMQAAPSHAIVVSHVVVFFSAAAIVVLVMSSLQPRVGWFSAILMGFIVLFAPLFSAQVEQIGTPLVMTGLVLLALRLLVRGRWFTSSLVMLAAVQINTAAMPAILGILIYLAFQLRNLTNQAAKPFLGFCTLLVVTILLNWWSPPTATQESPTRYAIAMGGWDYVARFWAPDVALSMLLSLAVGLLLFREHGESTPENATSYSLAFARLSWCVLVASVVWGAFHELMPPDLTLSVALMAIVFGAAALASGPLKVPATVLAVGLLVFQISNQHGRFYPDPAILHGPEFARTGSALLRSLEYRVDHRANIEAVKSLVERGNGRPVISGAPLTHFLSIPRLGYVEKPVQGYSLQPMVQASPNMALVNSALVAWPDDPIYLLSANPYFYDSPAVLLTGPTENDTIIYRDGETAPLIAYHPMKHESTEETLSWVLDRFSLYASVYHRALSRAIIYEHRGELDKALGILEEELNLSPANSEVRVALAKLLLKQGDFERAKKELALALQHTPQHVEATVQMGLLRLKQEQLEEAVELFEHAIEESPDRADVHEYLAAAMTRQGRFEEAIKHLTISLGLEPDNPDTHFNLGILNTQIGNKAVAIEHFREAIRLRPDFRAAQQALSQLEATQP